MCILFRYEDLACLLGGGLPRHGLSQRLGKPFEPREAGGRESALMVFLPIRHLARQYRRCLNPVPKKRRDGSQ